jgi:uncharacterized membrane protein
MKYLIITLLTFFLSFNFVFARDNVDDWYIKDYFVKYQLNLDSSVKVLEKIKADCGDNLRHGIYRNIDKQGLVINNIEVKNHNYKISRYGNTVEIKIGDPNVFVSGENNYEISYTLGNSLNKLEAYDEFYYNILGHNWSLEIDNFKAQIVFPQGLNKENVEISLYSGLSGNKDNQLAHYSWLDKNTLEISSKRKILPNEGITLSASFPSGIIDIKEFDEPRGLFAFSLLLIPFFILPIFVILIAWYIFRKNKRKNPYYKKAIVPQYSPPDNLSPIKLGYIISASKKLGQLITATIIRFASLKLITIADKEEKTWFFKYKTLEFRKTNSQSNYHQLDEIEKYIFDLIFKDKDLVVTQDLKKILAHKTQEISKKLKADLKEKGYLQLKTPKIKIIYGAIAAICAILMSPIAVLIMLFFFMSISNRTDKGEKINWENKGFLMFLKIANKDRHHFYEKENIFSKLLPYAIAFNLTSQFIRKMEHIYDQEQIKSSMSWYAGYSSLSSIEALSASLNSISRQVSSSTSTGRGGGGFSGGGRGGGGGGGW